jgi:hypothetical protein
MDQKPIIGKMVEFYIPKSFRRKKSSIPVSECGRVLPFRARQEGSCPMSYLERRSKQLVSGESRMIAPEYSPPSHL